MGIMYKIRKVKGEPVFDNWNKLMNHDIVELEEIQEEKEETLADKLYKENQGYRVTSSSAITLERIAKEHFQSHPEELGLVRIEDVLRVFDEARNTWNPQYTVIAYTEYLRKAIEGMKGDGK